MTCSLQSPDVPPHTQPTVPVAVAFGDGIGPEIMRSVIPVLEEAGAALEYLPIEVGETVYRAGFTSGLRPDVWDILRSSRALLKAPITTPQGGGYKSLNVTLRKSLGLYANVRPCVAYAPYVRTLHPRMNVVVVRENEEDLYAGIEHRQTDEVYQCLKLISRPGCERIVRYALEYARSNGRKKVTCMTKDNIMKLTDGLFHRVFDEIGAEYPEIEKEHLIIDIGMARVATQPERFDVIVTPNLYGDILSDVAAEVAGSVGLAPSANIGPSYAMFEAIHGSAPDIAGRDMANPSGLLLAAVMMLVHVGQPEVAARIHNAWLATIEEGIHTADVFSDEHSTQRVGTQAFGRAVRSRLGQLPRSMPAVSYLERPFHAVEMDSGRELRATRVLDGVDVFVQWSGDASGLAERLQRAAAGVAHLQMITNRGVKVWPSGQPETLLTDHWRCRFVGIEGSPFRGETIPKLISKVMDVGLEFVKVESLFTFDGEAGYSLGQGQ
ncbi:MAG: NADP-dependent isocitrate dehydrogenase [Fimbriimonadaceae bacterium]